MRAKLLDDRPDDVLLRFEVADTGTGIAADIVPRLFSAFEQADNTISRKYGGTGLGLAITRRIAELMGGEVGVTSQLGTGSTFWVTVRLRKAGADHATFDASVAADAAKDAEQLLKSTYSGTRVLLAEDEPINREVTLAILESAGLVADVAEDGHRAVELAGRNSYALILMDMQMPNLDGLEATRMIRRLPAGKLTPILAITANAFAEDRARCFEAGMNDFIPKPISPEILLVTVLHWLRRQLS